MEVKLGYKQSEVGVIPEDWDVKTINQIGFVTSGKRLPLGCSLVDHPTPHPYIRVTDMRPGTISLSDIKFVPESVFPAIKRYRIYRDDIFISVAGSLGIVGKIPNELDGSNLTENADRITDITCSQDFLLYVLMSPLIQKTIDTIRTVGAQPKLALTRIRQFAIPLPPSDTEQRAIATVLGDVDALLCELDRLIAKKRDIKRAAMQQLLTGKTRLPGFGGEWETKRLADVSAFITKGSTPTTYGFGWQLSGVLFLRSVCVSSEGLDLGQSMFISAEAHRVLRRSAVQSNDLLITITGNVGRVVRLSGEFGEANINQHIARIRIVDEATHPGWVYHFLSQPGVRQHFEKITTGQAYPQISLAQVRDSFIPRPPIAEQREVSAALDDMDGEITALEARRKKTRVLRQAMMQELLTGKTRLVSEGAAHA